MKSNRVVVFLLFSFYSLSIYPMLVKARSVARPLCAVQKRYAKFQVPVGSKRVTFDEEDLARAKNIPQLYEDICTLGSKKCSNTSPMIAAHFCTADTCCSKVLCLSGDQKAKREASFLKKITAQERYAYLQDVQKIYEQLIYYRVMLNELCYVPDKKYLQPLYSKIKIINSCLFDQAGIILEDELKHWQRSGFIMTPEIEAIRLLRDEINESYLNEWFYGADIADPEARLLYQQALTRDKLRTHRTYLIEEDYKAHKAKQQAKE